MKKILIIAGPNGAGKTTFANEFLPHEAECPEFVNADLIAAGLSPFRPDKVAFTAGRLMLKRIDELVASQESFAFETTLATRSWIRLIPQWQFHGYCVKLYFLKLPDPEFAIRRVAQRVQLGGHDIPTETIRRRFARGLNLLEERYHTLVDEWSIYDGSKNPPRLLDAGDNRPPSTLMEDSASYQTPKTPPRAVIPLDDSDFIGAEAAFRRAASKAVSRAIAAGLKPVVAKEPPAKP